MRLLHNTIEVNPMNTKMKYSGPSGTEIWQTDFFPAEEVYDDHIPLYGMDLEIGSIEEASCAGYLTL